jgi:hypothetical protein
MTAVEVAIHRDVQMMLEDWAIWQRERASPTRSGKKAASIDRTPGPTDTP